MKCFQVIQIVSLYKVAVSHLAALKRPASDMAHSSLGCFPADEVALCSVYRLLHSNQPEKDFYQPPVSMSKRMKKLQCLHG